MASQTAAGSQNQVVQILEHAKQNMLAKLLADQHNLNINQQDENQQTALIQAVIDGDLTAVEALIAANADLNIKDKYGKTALSWALSLSNEQIAQALLQAHANTDIADDQGVTPLMDAVRMGSINLIRTILAASKKTINFQDTQKNQTALMIAINIGNSTIVNLLLSEGASILPVNTSGQNALDLARDKKLHLPDMSDKEKKERAKLAEKFPGMSAELPKERQEDIAELQKTKETSLGSIIDLLAERKAGQAARLRRDVKAGDEKIIAQLLDSGFDANTAVIDKRGNASNLLIETIRTMSAANPQEAEATVTRLLAAGADPKQTDHMGRTPLMSAVVRNNINIIEQLLAKKVDIHAKDTAGKTALDLAIEINKPDLIKRLITAGAKPHKDQFFEAVTFGKPERVALLAQYVDTNSTDKSGKTALIIAAEKNDAQKIAILLANKAEINKLTAGERALTAAAQAHAVEAIKALLQAGADIKLKNGRNLSALFIEAANPKSADGVAALIQAGANVNFKGGQNRTPLMRAIQAGNLASVRLLLAAKADATAVDSTGETALPLAIQTQTPQELLEALLAAGAPVNTQVKEFNGKTPLMLAIDGENLPLVKLLLAKHADPLIKNTRGATALQHAEQALKLNPKNPDTVREIIKLLTPTAK